MEMDPSSVAMRCCLFLFLFSGHSVAESLCNFSLASEGCLGRTLDQVDLSEFKARCNREVGSCFTSHAEDNHVRLTIHAHFFDGRACATSYVRTTGRGDMGPSELAQLLDAMRARYGMYPRDEYGMGWSRYESYDAGDFVVKVGGSSVRFVDKACVKNLQAGSQ